MVFRLPKIDDTTLFRWGLTFTGGLMATSIPACLATLTMVGPLQRVYIAVLSSLLVVMVVALLMGTLRETLRMVRHTQVMVRAFHRRRAAATPVTTPAHTEPLPA